MQQDKPRGKHDDFECFEKLEFKQVFIYLALPLIIILMLSFGPPSVLKVGFFGFLIVLYAFIYPWVGF